MCVCFGRMSIMMHQLTVIVFVIRFLIVCLVMCLIVTVLMFFFCFACGAQLVLQN